MNARTIKTKLALLAVLVTLLLSACDISNGSKTVGSYDPTATRNLTSQFWGK